MQVRADHSTVELTRTRLRLRPDLRFIPQQYGDETYYHIEVATSSQYYRIGFAEYTFVSLLDGRTSFSQALAMTAQALGAESLSQAQALTVYAWLLDRQLAEFADADPGGCRPRSPGASSRSADRSLFRRFNPLWIRIPLGRPQSLLRVLQPYTNWLFSAPATLLAILLMLAAIVTVRRDWDRFTQASETVFAPHNWLWLLLAWVGLKVVHETAHGLVCMKYGGTIRSVGVVLAFFAPLAYVDASSCWSFSSRRQRIHTAAAGIYAELLVAALAVFGWSSCDSPNTAHLLHSVIVMASLSTLIFNLNPLMRFDGYYVLSDLLNIPNLASESGRVVSQTLRRILTGHGGSLPVVAGHQRGILLAYGAAAAAWRLLVGVSILIAASVLFHGAGVVLTMAGVTAWFGKPIWSLGKSSCQLWQRSPALFLRGAVICGAGAAAGGILLFVLPAPVLTTAPGIVEYTNGQVVRASTAGFVEIIHVEDGQFVRRGDALLELSNVEVSGEHFEIVELMLQEEIRLQKATRECDSGAISIAQANLQSLSQKRTETERKRNGLILRAATDGRIVSRQLQHLQGTFVREGQELLTIGLEDHKELRLSVGQRELASALNHVSGTLPVRIGTRGRMMGLLKRVNPQGTRSLPHPALAAVSGGELQVVEEDADERPSDSTQPLRLTEHRFDGVMTLDPEDARQLRCGERGVVCLGRPQGSLGVHLYRSGQRWLQAQVENAVSTQ